ncbi:beta-lactamase-like protein [Lipomyces kononenkoae]|uniref:Beta-lactamase-like protein n=1 Tax=Lipomyces kononenkoae TaxID=34357 RepID=A0ACC3SR78_LIPKO
MASVEVVAHRTRDVESWVLAVKTGGAEYLFGRFGEGTQRVLADQGLVRLGRVRQVFVTGSGQSWTELGGVAGLLIGGTGLLTVYGSRRLQWAMATLRGVEFRQQVRFDVRYASTAIGNESMTVTPVELADATTDATDAVDDAATEQVVEGILQDMGSTTTQTRQLPVPPFGQNNTTMCYVIQPHAKPGRFNVAEAERLGVPKGPGFGQLRKGFAVTTPAGIVVRPEMVIEPGQDQDRIVVVDLATPGFVRAALDYWGSSSTSTSSVSTVMHILGPDIDPFSAEYARFMRLFPSTCRHLLAHPAYVPDAVAATRAAQVRTRLAAVWPSRFPVAPTTTTANPIPAGQDLVIEPAMARPDQPDVDGICGKVQAALSQQQDNEHPTTTTSSSSSVECVCVGTGSGGPSVFRNAVGTVVRISDACAVVLDCGEATYGGLRAMFSDAGVAALLAEIALVFVSHMHPDHHLGLVTLVDAWTRAAQTHRTLYVVGPRRIQTWLDDWAQVYDSFRDRVRFIDAECCCTTASGLTIKTVPAIHCDSSYSVVLLRSNSTAAVAYSGDTRPNVAFAAAARNATLLIHEATLDDTRVADAVAKQHSTVTEALLVARHALARNVVLTHISPRYSLEFMIGLDATAQDASVTVALDGMIIRCNR